MNTLNDSINYNWVEHSIRTDSNLWSVVPLACGFLKSFEGKFPIKNSISVMGGKSISNIHKLRSSDGSNIAEHSRRGFHRNWDPLRTLRWRIFPDPLYGRMHISIWFRDWWPQRCLLGWYVCMLFILLICPRMQHDPHTLYYRLAIMRKPARNSHHLTIHRSRTTVDASKKKRRDAKHSVGSLGKIDTHHPHRNLG